MKCAWQAYINLVPPSLRTEVSMYREQILELRLRLGRPPELILKEKSLWMKVPVKREALEFVINGASGYSPWVASTLRSGFITASGGHRVGVCGDVVVKDGVLTTISSVTSLSLRVARNVSGISPEPDKLIGSVLIIGSPGVGKTTLLRDMVRRISNECNGCVAVVDERGEIFPLCNNEFVFDPGPRTDVITGCSKKQGIEMLLRTMTPTTIAVDEITAKEDCEGLHRAGWCGVRLIATAHAANLRELRQRPVYRPILESGLFQTLVILHPDKSWSLERLIQ